MLSVLLYWITVILGIFDTELFNVELPDPGLEFDADVDLDAEVDAELDTGVVWGIAHWFYVGEVPVMVLVSIFILSLWAGAILGNYYFNPMGSWLRAFAIFNVNWVFNAAPQVMGSQCRIITTQVTASHLGQAEVATKGAPLVLNVRAQENQEFKKDDIAVIVSKDKETGAYTIGPVKK
jgi:hypothetical protein